MHPSFYYFLQYIHQLYQGSQHLTSKIHVVSSRASQSAIKAVEKLGGTVFCKYYNRLALRDCVKGRTDRISAAPTRKQDIRKCFFRSCAYAPHVLVVVWYTNWRNRGYLSAKAVKKMPSAITEERWKDLSAQLLQYKKEKQPIKH